jgi:septum site-determining protein MinD
MLKIEDVLDILAISLLGVIPESESVLKASNLGQPIIFDETSKAGQAYADVVGRYLGEQIDHRFMQVERRGLFQRLLWRTA